MTKNEHVEWCKKRAIQEYDFYSGTDKQRSGLISMMSDMSKHPETNSPAIRALIMAYMTRPMTRQQFINFINGFN